MIPSLLTGLDSPDVNLDSLAHKAHDLGVAHARLHGQEAHTFEHQVSNDAIAHA